MCGPILTGCWCVQVSEQQRSNGGEDEAAYERELAALREISAAAEREVALRQQARGRIANPMHAVSTHQTLPLLVMSRAFLRDCS